MSLPAPIVFLPRCFSPDHPPCHLHVPRFPWLYAGYLILRISKIRSLGLVYRQVVSVRCYGAFSEESLDRTGVECVECMVHWLGSDVGRTQRRRASPRACCLLLVSLSAKFKLTLKQLLLSRQLRIESTGVIAECTRHLDKAH